MDFFELAASNAEPLEERYEKDKDARPDSEAAMIEAFAGRVREEGRVSINMTPWILNELLPPGRTHQNIHEWAAEQSSLSGRPADDILREKLGKYYARRLAFDDAFDNGQEFRYGVLNIGGIGAERYGIFCTILSEASLGESLAYLKCDSLNVYVDDKANVDTDKIQNDVAPRTSRHHLAAMKHMDDVVATGEDEWGKLLCNDMDYIEAIFLGTINRADFEEVRMTEAEHERLVKMAFDDFDDTGKSLSEGERALVQDFVGIRRADRDGDITLRRI